MENLISLSKETKNVNWYNEKVLNIITEIKESNGKINDVVNEDNLIKVMSRISNYIRCDIISQNEIITYKVSPELQKEAMDLFS
jgi:hypothetical protein